MSRLGWGFDTHAFGGDGPLRLCGVDIEGERGLAGTSDGDVALHAVVDALLGAAALGDLGELLGPGENWKGADSRRFVRLARARLEEAGYRATAVDVTIIAEAVRIAPHRAEMRSTIAGLLGLDVGSVSVKATSTDGLGFTGRGEGIAAAALATIVERDP